MFLRLAIAFTVAITLACGQTPTVTQAPTTMSTTNVDLTTTTPMETTTSTTTTQAPPTTTEDPTTFAARLRAQNVQFDMLHYDMDYWLRLARFNATEILKTVNNNVIRVYGASVTDIRTMQQAAYNLLVNRSIELGNENGCILNLDRQLILDGNRAGLGVSQCAYFGMREFTTVTDNFFYNLTDRIQRDSTLFQTYVQYQVAQSNIVQRGNQYLNLMQQLYRNAVTAWEDNYRVAITADIDNLRIYGVRFPGFVTRCIAPVVNGFGFAVAQNMAIAKLCD